MTKTDRISSAAEKTAPSKADAEKAVSAIIDSTANALKGGVDIQLPAAKGANVEANKAAIQLPREAQRKKTGPPMSTALSFCKEVKLGVNFFHSALITRVL